MASYSPSSPSSDPSALISARIDSLPDWRGQALARVRALIHEADPGVIEEWKWRGVPVWSHDGILCTGETYKAVVKVTFAQGAALPDPAGLFNASLDGNVRRAIDLREGESIDGAAFKALIRAAVALNRSAKTAARARASGAGYSATPLASKLGFKPSSRVLLLNAPRGYRALLDPLPEGLRFSRGASTRVDIAQVFVSTRRQLEARLSNLRQTLDPDAVLWVSWPKQSSGVASDVTEDTIRAVALPLGYVDIKVCAVSEVWSGLKLVLRKDLRH